MFATAKMYVSHDIYGHNTLGLHQAGHGMDITQIIDNMDYLPPLIVQVLGLHR